jgi:hypothetical protein
MENEISHPKARLDSVIIHYLMIAWQVRQVGNQICLKCFVIATAMGPTGPRSGEL